MHFADTFRVLGTMRLLTALSLAIVLGTAQAQRPGIATLLSLADCLDATCVSDRLRPMDYCLKAGQVNDGWRWNPCGSLDTFVDDERGVTRLPALGCFPSALQPHPPLAASGNVQEDRVSQHQRTPDGQRPRSMRQDHSPASLSAVRMISGDSLKFTRPRSARRGAISGMMPSDFAFSRTPTVPVCGSARSAANLRADQSSRINTLPSISMAKAIALASPGSTCSANRSIKVWL